MIQFNLCRLFGQRILPKSHNASENILRVNHNHIQYVMEDFFRSFACHTPLCVRPKMTVYKQPVIRNGKKIEP